MSSQDGWLPPNRTGQPLDTKFCRSVQNQTVPTCPSGQGGDSLAIKGPESLRDQNRPQAAVPSSPENAETLAPTESSIG